MRTIEYKKEEKTGIITLSRPERLNVICNDFLDDLQTVLFDYSKIPIGVKPSIKEVVCVKLQ